MRVLVIGGNRFFGKRLVEKFARQHVDLSVMNRSPLAQNLVGKVNHIPLDRKTLRKDHPILSGKTWDIVYDQVCYDASEARGACEAFEGKVGKYIFTSSQSVYDLGADVREPNFDPYLFKFSEYADRHLLYAEAKRQAEAVFFQEAKFPVTALRFPIVMGEDDYTDRLKFHVQRIQEQKPIYFPNPMAKMCFVHAADAARFMALLAQIDLEGPVNCCATEPIILRDLIRMIEGKTGQKAIITSTALEGEESPYGIEGDWYMNTEKMRSTGFECTPMREWLTILIARLMNPELLPHQHDHHDD